MGAASPTLLICGFGPFPNFPANPSQRVVEHLREAGWAPSHAQAAYAVLPTTWAGAAETLRERLADTGARGVLLTGVAASATAFRVELRACNLTTTVHADADGVVRDTARIAALGPAALRPTAPIEAVLSAIRAEGLPAEASSDAGDYLCNFTLYSLLLDRLDEPAAFPLGFLHLPPAPEAPPDAASGGRCFALDELARGVKATASVFARALAFAPQPRLNDRA